MTERCELFGTKRISKCQIQDSKEPKCHFEMALNKVKQLVSEPHELFFYHSPSKWLATLTSWQENSQLASRTNRLQTLSR